MAALPAAIICFAKPPPASFALETDPAIPLKVLPRPFWPILSIIPPIPLRPLDILVFPLAALLTASSIKVLPSAALARIPFIWSPMALDSFLERPVIILSFKSFSKLLAAFSKLRALTFCLAWAFELHGYLIPPL